MKKASEKILYIIGGVNGAGKTTFAENAMSNSNYGYVNPDKMAFEINKDYSAKANLQAGREVLGVLEKNIKEGKPIIWETCLSGKSYKKICQAYKNNGYMIDLTYIFLLDESTHFTRIAERVAAGGHDISEIVVSRRFSRRVENFNEATEISDTWRMLCNQHPWFELVAFGHGNAKMISNYELYKNFCDSAKYNPIEKFRRFAGFHAKVK